MSRYTDRWWTPTSMPWIHFNHAYLDPNKTDSKWKWYTIYTRTYIKYTHRILHIVVVFCLVLIFDSNPARQLSMRWKLLMRGAGASGRGNYFSIVLLRADTIRSTPTHFVRFTPPHHVCMCVYAERVCLCMLCCSYVCGVVNLLSPLFIKKNDESDTEWNTIWKTWHDSVMSISLTMLNGEFYTHHELPFNNQNCMNGVIDIGCSELNIICSRSQAEMEAEMSVDAMFFGNDASNNITSR